MKHGVSTVPRSKTSRPRRAAPEVADISNVSELMDASQVTGRRRQAPGLAASVALVPLTSPPFSGSMFSDQLHLHEAVFGAGRLDHGTDALLVGLVADEQHDHALHRARGNLLERLDHLVGLLGRARAGKG